jgi:alpha-galactosidase
MSKNGPKITLIGAGSTVFAKNLIGDILTFPELQNSHIVLFDINEERLKTSEIVARKICEALNVAPKITVTTDAEKALEGSDYAISMIQVGGYKPSTIVDFEIPKKYGLQQTIGDTLGIGGIMRGLRTIPVLLEYTRIMERVSSPNILHLNYVNPMAMNCWALAKASKVQVVGLCHSVQGTAHELAEDLGIPDEELDYIVAGINHMAFYLKLEHKGVDMYPRLREFLERGNLPERALGSEYGWKLANHVRYEVFKHFGHFVTESSEHFSEYVPWFIKPNRPDIIEKFKIPIDEYIRRCEAQIKHWDGLRLRLEDSNEKMVVKRSKEYGSRIIHSRETGEPRVIYGNVRNDNLISSLPNGCCVEVPCLVDKNGIQPTRIGALPPQLAAMMRTNINVQELTVEAALTGNREHVYHAAMMDPHTAAELDLDQIRSLVDDLLEAHGKMMPEALRLKSGSGTSSTQAIAAD